MNRSTLIRTAAVGAACALAGGAAGIAEGSASTTTHKTNSRVRRATARNGELRAGPAFAGPLKGFATPVMTAGGTPALPVHSEAVVPNEKGGFETVTMDSGTFSSLSGEQLTIDEGTRKATYKTVTLTIPSDATVYRNGEKASLSDIKAGDMVSVVQSSSGTEVNAFDEQHEPKLGVKVRAGGGPGKETSQEGEGPPAPKLQAVPAPPGGAGAQVSAQANEGGPSS